GTPSWTISRTCCCSSISTGRAASRTGIRSAASTPSSNMRRLSRYRPLLARSSRPPAASADSIRQAVLLATPSSRATWVAPSSGWAEKQLSTEAAIDTDRNDADGSRGTDVTDGAEVARARVAGGGVAAAGRPGAGGADGAGGRWCRCSADRSSRGKARAPRARRRGAAARLLRSVFDSCGGVGGKRGGVGRVAGGVWHVVVRVRGRGGEPAGWSPFGE